MIPGMKALVHTAPFTFELRDVPRPGLDSGDVLVRVGAVGICGSDVHGMTGKTGRRIPPIIMGHEASGEIVETGTGVEPEMIGRRVTFDSMIYCGTCKACLSGQVNLCESRQVLGVSCDEYRRDGAFAEHIAVPARLVHQLPDSVSYEHAAMTEPLSVAVHAVRLSRLRPEDRVLVVGCGIIGLLTIQAARATGCGTIIATDLSDRRLDAALVSGADRAMKPEELSGQGEVDAAFEAVGAAQTVAAAIRSVRKGGTVVLIGNVTPEVPFPLQAVVTREIAVLGSCASAGEFAECVRMMEAGLVNLDPLITDVISLEDAASMFQALHTSPEDHLKAMVRPGGIDV